MAPLLDCGANENGVRVFPAMPHTWSRPGLANAGKGLPFGAPRNASGPKVIAITQDRLDDLSFSFRQGRRSTCHVVEF
jgi:hypothetical protein